MVGVCGEKIGTNFAFNEVDSISANVKLLTFERPYPCHSDWKKRKSRYETIFEDSIGFHCFLGDSPNLLPKFVIFLA